MAKASPVLTSVNSGEFSPRMAARIDFDRYRNACSRARNVILLPTGGFTKAPGTRYIAGILDQTKVGRLIPFKFSATDAYVIEMGESQCRFFRRQAKITCPDVGSEITGGDFDVTGDISYWDATGTGSITYDETGERLQLGQGTDEQYSATEQVIVTSTTGTEHVIRFKIDGAVGAMVRVVVGSTTDSDDLFDETELGVGWHAISFTPSSSPFYFGVRNYSDETIYLDDVTVLDNVDLTLPHDYSESQIQDIRMIQTADVLYLFHPDKPTRKFERRALRTWSLVTVPWEDGPYNEANEGFDFNLRQLLTNPFFDDGHKDWIVKTTSDASVEYDGAQRIVIFQRGSSSGQYAAIEQQVTTGVNSSTEFLLHFQIVGAGKEDDNVSLLIGTASGGTQILGPTNYEPGWHSITFTTSADIIYIRFRGSNEESITSGLGGALLYPPSARRLELSGTEGSVTCTATGFSPFASTDIGRLIRLNWPGKESSWGVITAYSSATSVTVRLRRKAPYANIPTEDWQLGSWSETNGYPSVATFFQSRLVAANTTRSPQTLWFTQTGDLENYRPDSFEAGASQTEDDDALTYLIAAQEVNSISWMSGERRLLIGTSGGEFVAESEGAAITATDISITRHADTFAKNADAVFNESAVVFIELSGSQVHDLGYDFNQDSFLSADLTILADHIFTSPCKEIVLQKRPYQIVWSRREDGRLAALSYNRRQDVVGWSQRIMGGAFSSGDPVVESVTVIPGTNEGSQTIASGDRDEVWVIVKRTIDGNTVRYIEVFEEYYEAPFREDYTTEAAWETAVKSDMQDAVYVDSAYTYDNSATDTITSLDHLEGESVIALADGRVVTGLTVSSGSVTLPFEASKVQVGLPYKWSFETLKLPYGTQSGSALGKQKMISACTLALVDSGKFTFGVVSYSWLNGRLASQTHEQDFYRDSLALDEAIPLFTGEYYEELESAEGTDVRIYMEDEGPLPFTCLAIAPQMSSTERGATS